MTTGSADTGRCCTARLPRSGNAGPRTDGEVGGRRCVPRSEAERRPADLARAFAVLRHAAKASVMTTRTNAIAMPSPPVPMRTGYRSSTGTCAACFKPARREALPCETHRTSAVALPPCSAATAWPTGQLSLPGVLVGRCLRRGSQADCRILSINIRSALRCLRSRWPCFTNYGRH
jgi:hypothetical protein